MVMGLARSGRYARRAISDVIKYKSIKFAIRLTRRIRADLYGIRGNQRIRRSVLGD